jgi:hypothetical protein
MYKGVLTRKCFFFISLDVHANNLRPTVPSSLPVGVTQSGRFSYLELWCATNFREVEYPATFTEETGKLMFDSENGTWQEHILPQQNVPQQQMVHAHQAAPPLQMTHPSRIMPYQQHVQQQQMDQLEDNGHQGLHLRSQRSSHRQSMHDQQNAQSPLHSPGVSISAASVPISDPSVAQPASSLKRKSEDDPSDASRVEKRIKADTPIQRTQAERRHAPETPMKKQKYRALQDVKDTQLPDYSRVRLPFDSRGATALHSKQRLDALKEHFPNPATDLSIPNTDTGREDAVRLIFGAMKDISRAKDAGSNDFKSRWAVGAKKPYKDEDLAATAWEIVRLIERLHEEGPSALSIRDEHYDGSIVSSAHLTFKERLTVIATICMEWKARNDGLIKGTTLETTVAAPLEALQSAIINNRANKDRAKKIKYADAHEGDEGAPLLRPKKRSKSCHKFPSITKTNVYTESGVKKQTATAAKEVSTANEPPQVEPPSPAVTVEQQNMTESHHNEQQQHTPGQEQFVAQEQAFIGGWASPPLFENSDLSENLL